MDIKKFKLDYPFEKTKLINQLYKNVSMFTTPIKGLGAPGIQTVLILKTDEINYILDNILNIAIKTYFNGNKPMDYVLNPWVYISRKENVSNFYHEHTKLFPGQTKDSIVTDYTFTYYVQMPNNLKGDDGHIFFKKNDKEISFLPEENDLIFFPADLLNKPEKNPNSTLDRIVIAGNLKFNIQQIKNTNSIL